MTMYRQNWDAVGSPDAKPFLRAASALTSWWHDCGIHGAARIRTVDKLTQNQRHIWVAMKAVVSGTFSADSAFPTSD